MTRILIVDEDNDVLRLLRVKLSAAGYETSQARDGKEALNLADEQRPGIVIMETQLPDMDGLALLSQLRKKIHPAPQVLILSRESSDEHIQAALSAGAADYLTKPFSPQALLERLRVVRIRAGLKTADQER